MKATLLILLLLVAHIATAQSTFTYQGRLEQSGAAYTGLVDLEFRLFAQFSGGLQSGASVLRVDWPVEEGLFQVELDFGADAFASGPRFLEVVVDGMPLQPRQAVQPAPVALFALSGNAGPQGPAGPAGADGASPFSHDPSTGAIGYLHNQQVFRFVPNADPGYPPAITFGHASNVASGEGAVIGGGGAGIAPNVASGLLAVVAGGEGNEALGEESTISGGRGNLGDAELATVGGGVANNATGAASTIAGGANNTASNRDTAIGGGIFNTASGEFSTVAGGWGNEALGRRSTIAGGNFGRASGEAATIAGGVDNRAESDYASVGGGANNVASATHATAGGGESNIAAGTWATVAGGFINAASGNSATVGGGASNRATHASTTVSGGWQNTASGNGATVSGGIDNCAGGRLSWAGGFQAQVRPGAGSGAVGIGCMDAPVAGTADGDAGTFAWADSTNASFVSTGPDQFLVRAGGGVGINTNAPRHALHVRGASPTTVFEGQFLIEGAETSGAMDTGGSLLFAGHDGEIDRVWGGIRTVKEIDTVGSTRSVMRFYTRGPGGVAPQEHMRIDSSGVTYNSSGTWATFSDRRLKRDIAPIDDALARLLALEGVRFHYRDPAQVLGAEGLRMGFIAQQVEQVFPQWVGADAEGYRFIAPVGFEALAVEALRELASRQAQADATLHDYRQQLAAAQARIAELEHRLLQPSRATAALAARLGRLEAQLASSGGRAGVAP